jgi:hypothetical protein
MIDSILEGHRGPNPDSELFVCFFRFVREPGCVPFAEIDSPSLALWESIGSVVVACSTMRRPVRSPLA